MGCALRIVQLPLGTTIIITRSMQSMIWGERSEKSKMHITCVVVRAGTQEGRCHDQRSVLLLSATMTEDTVYPYTNDTF